MKRLIIIILTIILCSCTAVEQPSPADRGTIETEIVIVAATAIPTRLLSETSTPTASLSPVETPFWLSYEGRTAVPIATGYPLSNRTDYAEMDINVGLGFIWLPPFKASFDLAVANNQDWIRYPERIALRITGYPNPDYVWPDEVLLFQTAQNSVIAILTDRNLMGDSASAVQYQVEMSKSADHWQVNWLGAKWRCQKNRGHEDWGTVLCS